MLCFYVDNPFTIDLLELFVNSYEEAYILYDEYAFRMGFNIRKSNQRYRVGSKTLLMKRFCCSITEEKEKLEKAERRLRHELQYGIFC